MTDSKEHNFKSLTEIKLCKFCTSEAVYSPIEQMEENAVKVYFCKPCNAEYLFWESSGNLLSHSLYINLNSKTYRWSVSFIKNEIAEAHLWHIKDPGIPNVRINQNLIRLKMFKENIPTITPENIKEKISKYLLII